MTANGQEVQGLKDAVAGVNGAETLLGLIAELEKRIENKEKHAKYARAMKGVVDLFRLQADKDQACPLCKRGLAHGTDEMKKFEEVLS